MQQLIFIFSLPSKLDGGIKDKKKGSDKMDKYKNYILLDAFSQKLDEGNFQNFTAAIKSTKVQYPNQTLYIIEDTHFPKIRKITNV